MILLQGVGTNVSEKLYFEASNAFKQDLPQIDLKELANFTTYQQL